MGECGLEALYRAWLPVWPLHDDIEVICSASHTFVFRFVSLVHPLQDSLLLEALAIAKAQRAELVDSDAEVLAGEVDTGDNTVLLERAVVTAVRVRTLTAGNTVRILTGPRTGELGIVSEAKDGSYEVDDQWFERSQVELQF